MSCFSKIGEEQSAEDTEDGPPELLVGDDVSITSLSETQMSRSSVMEMSFPLVKADFRKTEYHFTRAKDWNIWKLVWICFRSRKRCHEHANGCNCFDFKNIRTSTVWSSKQRFIYLNVLEVQWWFPRFWREAERDAGSVLNTNRDTGNVVLLEPSRL